MTDVFTHTLTSGYELDVFVKIDFGELIMASLSLALLSLITIDLIYRIADGRYT